MPTCIWIECDRAPDRKVRITLPEYDGVTYITPQAREHDVWMCAHHAELVETRTKPT